MIGQLLRDTIALARVAAKGDLSARGLASAVVQDSFTVVALTRLRELARRLELPLVNRLLRLAQVAIYGIEIGKDVTLGDGVYFVHTLGTVIGGDARVGHRVTFMGNNTVGTAKDNGYPTIGDDVVVGAGARILGPIRVGARAVIGANAVVLNDVPAFATAMGVPAKVKPPPAAAPSRYEGQLRASITRYVAGDRDEILAFRRRMYGERSVYAEPAYVDWLYGGRGDDTPLWVYRRNGGIEGHQGGVRVGLKVGGVVHDAMWTIDMMVSPETRSRGVGPVLSRVAWASAPCLLGVEVSDAARKVFVRAGWVDLGDVPLFVHPFDTAAVLDRLGHPLARLPKPVLDAPHRLGLGLAAALVATSGLRLAEVADFPAAVDALWSSVCDEYPVIARRDRAYLRWRYVAHPHADGYRRLLLWRGDTLAGWAVIRRFEHRGLPAASLVDFLCAPRDTPALLAHVLRVVSRWGVSALYCLHRNPRAEWAFTAVGFARRHSGWPLLVHAPTLSEAERVLLADPGAWFLTSGDSDVDRIREGTVYAPDLTELSVVRSTAPGPVLHA